MVQDAIIRGAIYVDDSGNPGAESGSDFLPSARKSWTAVIVPSVIAAHVQAGMDIFLNGVRGEFGVAELHFTEIFSNKGAWRRVSVERRAEVINLMADVMAKLGLPIVHQTVADFTMLDHAKRLIEGRTGDWDLEDISHLGLLMLCSGVSRHIRTMAGDSPDDFNLPFPLYMDEGIMPAGGQRTLPNWGDVIEGPKACFRNSADVAGLQLADFAAFVINRSQWISATRTLGPISPAEDVILRAAAGLNIVNLPFHSVAPEEFGRETYEERLVADRVANGLTPRPSKRI
ncbi:DUF3800 domain-containing protein [Rhizobium laguerreae]|uniref:DUF3800 domain-containing protein n=1 Tax=Rhizobium laguerreae TaxID=1076926 RepID=UPI001C90B133|nr:DUF3800 domain-containing protein [Rhizobium laguerreae]MBY3101305.1 DUF3800 domain-containing protein [Rhizobium laguerreae]